jgi:cleavage stimulation factor subunit 3
MEHITRGLVRTNLPRLPPALGFEGDQEYLQQVELWRRWIKWEREDPLVLKDEDIHAYQQRVLYTYKQAAMALRYWPEIWVEAAEWCFANGIEKDGTDQGVEFLAQGIAANPESCLLAFKHADRLESVLPVEENDDGLARRGTAIREPYDRLHSALYDLIKKVKARETRELAKIEESASLDATISAVIQKAEEDDEDAVRIDQEAKYIAKAKQLKAVQEGYAMQLHLLSRTISLSWIALMRAMRRVQGKGAKGPGGKPVSGSRLIFADARARGRITSDVYVASALIEHNVYKDPAGTKIFEKGAKLFPEDEVFILEYLKHLLSIGDTTSEYFPETVKLYQLLDFTIQVGPGMWMHP